MAANIPELVVFDLDFTLWDAGGTWCDCTNPPYHRTKAGEVFDSYHRQIRLYDDVITILEKLAKEDIPVALASRTDRPAWANQLTKLLRIDPFIQFREIYPGSKVEHLTNISRDSGVPLEKIVFFDDEHRNIHDTQRMGVSAVYVPNGLNRDLFTRETGIEV